MYQRPDIGQALTRITASRPNAILLLSLCIGLSIMYQVYFGVGFEQGQLTGGEGARLYLKVVFALLFFGSMARYCSFAAFFRNFFLKIPLLFVALTILTVAPFVPRDYTQALNLFFFLPVLCIDWDIPEAESLYRTIWAVITVVVAFQLALDPLFKVYFQVGWANAAAIGGMGNPNVFGVFLIAAGLASAVLLHSRLRYLSPILFMATVLTGSLVSSLVGFTCLLAQLVLVVRRKPTRGLVIVGSVIALLIVSSVVAEFITDSTAIGHVFGKLLGLRELIVSGSSPESASISLRADYLEQGLSMLGDAPLAILTGHPDAVPMYNGDGLWTSFLVTYGLPVTLYFLAANLVVVYRGLVSRSRDLMFSACIVAAMLGFFVSNRILDYWPAPLVYLLAFSYLATKGVRSYRGSVFDAQQAGRQLPVAVTVHGRQRSP